MQLFVIGGDLLSSSISNVLLAFHSGLSPCQNLLLEGRQYVVDVEKLICLTLPCRNVKLQQSIAFRYIFTFFFFAIWVQIDCDMRYPLCQILNKKRPLLHLQSSQFVSKYNENKMV